MEELTARAQTGYACELPGFGIRFDNFVPVMQRAVSTGWVTPADAAFVYDGLRDGFISINLDTGSTVDLAILFVESGTPLLWKDAANYNGGGGGGRGRPA